MVPFILLRSRQFTCFCCVSHWPLMIFYFILFVHCNWSGVDFTTLSWKASGVSKLIDKSALVAFEKPVIFYDLEFLSAQWIFMLFIIHFVGSVLGEQSGQLCVITRCNFTLFNEAANVCCANNDKKVGFVGVRRQWYFCFCFHKFVYHRTRAAPRFRAVRSGTSRVRKSYAYDPVRCKPCEMQNLEKRTGKMYQYCSENSFPATLGTMTRVMSRACNSCRERNSGR